MFDITWSTLLYYFSIQPLSESVKFLLVLFVQNGNRVFYIFPNVCFSVFNIADPGTCSPGNTLNRTSTVSICGLFRTGEFNLSSWYLVWGTASLFMFCFKPMRCPTPTLLRIPLHVGIQAQSLQMKLPKAMIKAIWMSEPGGCDESSDLLKEAQKISPYQWPVKQLIN